MDKIQAPVTLNAHKHHFHDLLRQMEIWKTMEWDKIYKELLLIGNNLLDFYTGTMTVDEVCTGINHFLIAQNILNSDDFEKWLYPIGYRKIILHDSSEWIIKMGNDPAKYVHIHPAKFSPHTIRVRANTLKTAIALTMKGHKILPDMHQNLQMINLIRTRFLQLSPVKSLHRGKGILQLWELFDNNY